ncbi:MAG: GumC family protein, partial [Acidobacteriota bacterium]
SSLLNSRWLAEQVVQRLHQEQPADASSAPWWREKARAMSRKAFKILGVVLHLRRPFTEATPQEREILEIRESMSGKLLPKSAVFRITAEHRNPDLATRLARLGAETFVEFTREWNAAEAIATRKFLEGQVRDAREALLTAQTTMDEFRRQHGIFLSLDDEEKRRVADLITLEGLSRAVESDLRQSQEKIEQTKGELGAQPRTIQSSMTTDVNPIIRNLRMQLITLESRLPALLVDFTPKHPQVVALQQQIDQISNQLQAEVQRELTSEVTALNPIHQTLLTSLAVEQINFQGLSARKAKVDSLVARVRGELSDLSTKKNKWDLLEADIRFYTARLSQMMDNLDTARIAEAKKLTEIKVLDVGIPPRFPTWKGLPLLVFPLVGLVMGVIGGGGLAMALYHLDPAVKDPESARTRLSLPLYGVVEGGANEMVTNLHPTSNAVWNSYRYARMKLLDTVVNGRPLRCLVITALTPGEDPVAVVGRLAAVCAEAGNRTFLVDCRGSNGSARGFGSGAPPVANLDILTNQDSALPPVSDPRHTEALLTLVQSRRSAYDVILLLAPSLDTSVTAAQLASSPEVDALLLVLWSHRTNLQACQEAKSHLEATGVRHIGLIFAR